MIKMGSRIEKASDYCTFCPKLCRFSCPVAQAEARETVTPWGLMSLLHMIRHDEVELSAEAGEVFFHCTGCLRCQTFCKHDNDVPEAMIAARRALVDRGVALPKALQGLDLRYERFGSPDGEVPPLPEGVAEAFDPDSRWVYVPEATRRGQDPASLAEVGRVLEAAFGAKAALVEEVNGQPVHDSGERLRQAGHAAWADMWQEHLVASLDGRELLVVESADFAARWHRSAVQPAIIHLVDLMVERVADLKAASTMESDDPLADKRVVFHDSCTVGRRLELYEGPRILVEALLGRAPEELWLNRGESLCCGAAGNYPSIDPEGAQGAAQILLEAVDDHGADLVITGDQGCAYHMAAGGADVVDLVEFVAGRL